MPLGSIMPHGINTPRIKTPGMEANGTKPVPSPNTRSGQKRARSYVQTDDGLLRSIKQAGWFPGVNCNNVESAN